MLFLLFACTSKPSPLSGVVAIVDPDRPVHYFDLPFPSDDLLSDGTADLSGYPEAPQPLAASIVSGWATRIGMTTHGFANNGPIYFRFEGHPDGFPEGAFSLAGQADDPVVLYDLDSGVRLPLTARFVVDPQGDPFYAAYTLAIAPAIGSTMASGARYAAVIQESAGVATPQGYTLPEGVSEGVVATVFTTQDAIGELDALETAAKAYYNAESWSNIAWKQVTQLDFAQGQSESGNDATRVTATYIDGTSTTTLLGPTDNPDDGTHTHDLAEWPVAVFEAYLPLPNFSGLEDRPYMSPGIAHINDTERYTGWIQFSDGVVLNEPDIEEVRLVLTLPKNPDGSLQSNPGVIIWDHGTSGHAYHVVQRTNGNDDGFGLAQIQADAGYAMIGRDAPLYGVRYPLIDEGYGDTLGYYNIVNLPAFRDNQRQTALEGEGVRAFVTDALTASLQHSGVNVVVDPGSIRRGGHSLGSVTSNLGVAATPESWDTVLLYGSGGLFTHFFLDTGMLEDLDPTLIESLFGLVGQAPPEDVTPASAFGAILGLEEAAWEHIDRLHPAIALFQWTMDPSDPMTIAPYETLPATMILCVGDRQVPNFTSEALAENLPDVQVVRVGATSDYDPHQCMHRERAGADAWAQWLSR